MKPEISKDYILSLEKTIDNNDCWLLTNYNVSNTVWIHGKHIYIHRLVAYLWYGGFNLFFDPVVTIICHKCQNDTNCIRICFNPNHIYIGSDSSNMLDAVKNKTHFQAQKTHCPSGHLYDRVYSGSGGIDRRRICSVCRRETLRRWRAKEKR